jgi:hypothetical protein
LILSEVILFLNYNMTSFLEQLKLFYAVISVPFLQADYATFKLSNLCMFHYNAIIIILIVFNALLNRH